MLSLVEDNGQMIIYLFLSLWANHKRAILQWKPFVYERAMLVSAARGLPETNCFLSICFPPICSYLSGTAEKADSARLSECWLD